MKRGTCATCEFFVDAKGECRFNPPTLVAISPRVSPPQFTSRWPEVDGDDWCSKWTTALVGGVRQTYPEQLSEADV